MRTEKRHTTPNILIRFAQLLGTELVNGKLEVPEKFGKGYCVGYVFNEYIRMTISNYELNEDLAVKNPETDASKRMIFFKFQNILPKKETLLDTKQSESMPSVLIATSRIYTDDIISIHTNTSTINIEIDANYLNGIFDASEQSPVLHSLLQNTQPLLFEEMIYSSIQEVVDEIIMESVDERFKLFFLRIKAEELICRLLIELEKREEKRLYPLNTHDILTLYKVKEKILEHLETPPGIKDLASYANMSPTKLKRLFKQVFGNSIFNYYQGFRMKEAAHLLKEEKLPVSEVGYSLGFTNLSHFSRTFEQHIGMKPKKYSLS